MASDSSIFSRASSSEGAVDELQAAFDNGLLSSDDGTALMDRLAGAARSIADESIEEAYDRSGDPAKIDEAEARRAEGDEARTSEAFKSAVARYKDAVSKAEGA